MESDVTVVVSIKNLANICFYGLLQLLNQIVCELPPEHPVSNVRPLRDSLGHTPLQVCWFYCI